MWGFEADDKIILFTGRVEAAKGVYFLLDAFTEACKEQPNLHLVFAGNGEIPSALKKIKSYQGRVLFTEFISKEKIKELYAIADMGVLPTLYDQCPYTVLEMMMYKLPLILSNIPGINEIYNDKLCLFIKPIIDEKGDISFSTKEIKEMILKLYKNKKQAIKLGEIAYKALSNKLSSTKMAKQMFDIYMVLCIN